MELDRTYRLAPHVVIRPERFGGLVYRHDDRRLFFLHPPLLVELVDRLDGTRPLTDCLDDFAAEKGLGQGDRDALTAALAKLEGIGILDGL